jgi:hypothetical protein
MTSGVGFVFLMNARPGRGLEITQGWAEVSVEASGLMLTRPAPKVETVPWEARGGETGRFMV